MMMNYRARSGNQVVRIYRQSEFAADLRKKTIYGYFTDLMRWEIFELFPRHR